MLTRVVLSAPLLFALFACEGPPAEGEGEGEGEGNSGSDLACDDSPSIPQCTEDLVSGCRDRVFNNLSMNLNTAGDGAIVSEAEDGATATFAVAVDATAGGFDGNEGWVYGKFTDEGLVKVELLDDAAFDSTDWDISFRRFVIRLNSGFSGPGCVSAARTPPDTDFEVMSCTPEEVGFNIEDTFMSDPVDCTQIDDGSGLPGSPGVVLQNWWEYPVGCVATTGNVFVVSLNDGRRIKLLVIQYYEGDGAQEECNEFGDAVGESARIKLRYGFIN